MRKDLLLKLADLLEADAKNETGVKFDMRHWIFTSDQTPSMSCGTTACAMGLAAISGIFKDEGLDYFNTPNSLDTELVIRDKDGTLLYAGGMSVAMALFDISFDEAHFLFMPSSYFIEMNKKPIGAKTELLVAQRIRESVTKNSL